MPIVEGDGGNAGQSGKHERVWQARKYVTYIVTLWRKSQEAPLQLLAAPQVRAAQVGGGNTALAGQGSCGAAATRTARST